jgi:GNAT superfamily N-acetyltransferase
MYPITREVDAGEIRDQLELRLRAFNEAAVGLLDRRKVVLAVRDDSGSLIGGLAAEIFWNCMYVESLWVAAEHRRQGYGAALLRQAEEIAGADACDVVYLNTFSFQAPGFYRKVGYTCVGSLSHEPRQFSREWFCKRLG